MKNGYSAWHNHQPSAQWVEDERLKLAISAAHEWNRGTYGLVKIQRELAEVEMMVAGINRKNGCAWS